MDGFNLGDAISLIIVFVIYLAAASGRNKKGKKRTWPRQRRTPVRTRAQGEQADRYGAERDGQTHAGFDDAFAYDTLHNAQAHCKSQPIHLHEVSQRQFANASEGEDPCHAGGVVMQEDLLFEVQKDAEREMLAQDVLRGVVMSEVLMRPHERAALRQGRR